MSSPSHDQAPKSGTRLVVEALLHLADKIESIKGINNHNQIITKDLTENAERLGKIAMELSKLIDTKWEEKVGEYIESNKKIIYFALNVYANDLRRSEDAILERVREIKGGDNEGDFFLNEFFKMNNLDQLLANIEEFKNNRSLSHHS
jgi:hypothetical protein